ncbi:hypothetical protein P691DRAFT_806135 [Macrolepiota fuliginosa MF-IS2]|uniref:DUF7918 domain-containing protein n=1 Tax=Macrolepiota fuliginosa MF-IS2 TaxID=1400762 RepID=A0A9P6C0Z9_9AGAR|nr:hypothetical protein P691DRAFT_806135 [Macrolepiota fuliginosa MF-IS2]
MPTWEGITITIQVDGVDIPEYLVEKDQAEKKVTCWVPSQVGKEFAVVLNAERRRQPWSTKVLADGVTACCIAWVDKAVKGHNVGYYKESPTIKRPFVFSKIELVDDDTLLHASNAARIGEIEIQCQAFNIAGTTDDTLNTSFEATKKIHERAKKGVAEHVGFGKAISVVPTRSYKPEWKEFIVTFVFRYRSLYYLQAQGIAPSGPRPRSLSPAPDPTPSTGNLRHKTKQNSKHSRVKREEMVLEISDHDENDKEIEALLAKVEEVRTRKRKQKQNAGSHQKKVKKEGKPTLTSGEVIDLT